MRYRIQGLLTTSCLTAVLAVTLGSGAHANPVDGQVVAGAATITETGKKLDIVQTTDRAVIDWRSFNIAPDEHTQFYQPSSSSIAVNRINSVDPSTIAGKLTANGNVVLINPNGVFFSKTATVDVNGLVATTADIDNSKFMAGGPLAFDKPGNPNAAIINEGSITAKDAGLVGLVAPNVINSGTITAKLGRVQLASGDSVTVDLYGDGLMEVKASDALTSQIVENSGRINAAGGTIALSAAAGRATVNSVVKVTGELLAPSIGQKNGKIIIAAEGSNKTSKTGSSTVLIGNALLDASGRNAGERGGSITVTGDDVTINAGSALNASGDAGGGSVLLGGDYQGDGTLATAQYLTLEQGAAIHADALSYGNGGRVILWSDESTRFAGAISARGGATGGPGGFVETSGKHYLSVSGTVDLAAADGSAGTWLLDPTDITLTNRSTPGDLTNSFSAAQLETMSSGANVSLSATNNITFDLTGDTVSFATAGRSLTLSAGNQIQSASTGTITTNNGAISLTGTNGIVLSHALGFNSGTAATHFTATNAPITFIAAMVFGGNTTLDAGTGTITADAITMGAHNLTLTSDSVELNGDLSGTGTLTLQPTSTTRGVRLANGPQEYSLVSTELDHLKDGWGNINIGRDDSTVTMYINYITWSDPVTFLGNEAKTLYSNLVGTSFTFVNGWTDFYGNVTTNGGDVTITRNRTDSASAYIDAGTVYGFGSTITTNGGDVNFSRYVPGTGTNTINTGNGNIVFQRDINRSYNTNNVSLVLNAGNGDITFNSTVNGTFGGGLLSLTASAANLIFNGAWGGSDALGNVSLTSLDTNFTMPTLTTAGNVSLNAGTGTITTGAITTGAGNLSLISDNITIAGDLTGTGDLLLRPLSNRNIRLNWFSGDYDIDGTELGHLKDGWNKITIGHTGASSFSIGDATWSDDLWLIHDTSGFGTTHLVGIQTFTGGASANYTGAYIDIERNVTTDGGSVTFNGVVTTYNNAVVTTNGGDVNFNASVRVNALDTPLNVNSGGGDIHFADTIFSINGSAAGKTLQLDAGAGAISFANTVNGAYNLTANATSLSFNGAWGGSTPLGSVSLTSVDTLTLPSISAASIFARTTSALADIILANTSHLSASGAGDAITLASGRNFLNSSGSATPFTLSGGGRWLTYSADPADDVLNGLTGTFTRTTCTYAGGCTGGTTIPASGNGFIYSYTPIVVTPTPDPTPTASSTASDLPAQVLRGINTSPYMPRYVLVELPSSHAPQEGDTPRKQRVDTTASNNNIDYDTDFSLTLSPALEKRLENYRDI